MKYMSDDLKINDDPLFRMALKYQGIVFQYDGV